jgi:hypothetical protein
MYAWAFGAQEFLRPYKGCTFATPTILTKIARYFEVIDAVVVLICVSVALWTG